MKYIIATHNAHKLIEISRILEPLGIKAVTDRELGIELPEVEETGTTFAENAYIKAAAACGFSGLPAIADDSGLAVDALDGAPGVYSARYAGEDATDEQRNEKLLEALRDVPEGKRQARFVSAVCCVPRCMWHSVQHASINGCPKRSSMPWYSKSAVRRLRRLPKQSSTSTLSGCRANPTRWQSVPPRNTSTC